MANNLSLETLKSHLFETLEGVKNLSDEEASPCEKIGIDQAKQIVDLADSIIDIYKVQLGAIELSHKMDDVASMKDILGGMGIMNREDIKLIGG